MTNAPANLLAVRTLLLTYLNVDKSAVRDADLEPAEVGIVGDASHRGGYHCGSNRTVANDYSVVESTRDRSGLTLYASALDVGTFSVRSGGKTHTLRTFSTWLVAQCAANTADTRDIREVIYSPDGRTVRRWDRLGKRTSGDSSHLFHTHISFFRDSTKAGRDQTPLFRRYLTEIGLLEDTMPLTAADKPLIRDAIREVLEEPRSLPGAIGERMAARGSSWGPNVSLWMMASRVYEGVISGDPVDEQEIVTGVLAGLPADKIAAAIPASLAREVVDELTARLNSPQG
ncbi:hypothetical protein [Micromonospora sp. WMMD998]|uniref:hypothetical protein n=1 Tax=Micromonospora sp. WMMD998 TaxID=3016092 RepID=UPI00249BB551|nr:hypothetical protein [Micromonospora sp. WMMD998]WFE41962.1 hypothetical protein O7619_27340 [Micromonospora sp. WMMD998]